MYRIITLSAIVLLGCSGCGKSEPQSSYVTKSDGEKISKTLDELVTAATSTVEMVKDHEARLTALETHSLAQSGGTGSLFVLNTRAESEPVSTSRTPYVNQPSEPAIRLTTNSTASGALPEDDLAIKFGKFKQTTEARLDTLDKGLKQRDELLAGHTQALERLTNIVLDLTDRVDGIDQSTQSLKRDMESLRSPRVLAEAPAPR